MAIQTRRDRLARMFGPETSTVLPILNADLILSEMETKLVPVASRWSPRMQEGQTGDVGEEAADSEDGDEGVSKDPDAEEEDDPDEEEDLDDEDMDDDEENHDLNDDDEDEEEQEDL